MARARRRATRSTAKQPSEPPSPLSSRSNTPGPGEPAPTDVNVDLNPSPTRTGTAAVDDSTCPSCTEATTALFVEKEKWIMCDACKTWYHWRCAGNDEDLDVIDKWFCKPCLETDPKRVITLKAPARKSHRKRTQRDYANMNAGLESDPNRWLRLMEGKAIQEDTFRRMKGSEVNLEWLEEDETAMQDPVIIESTDGLGMKMPPSDSFGVDDVVEIVGENWPVEVIDVASQSTSPGWTLGKWGEYFELEPEAREKVLNVISLEVSGTPLADKILPPKLVRDLDWVENFWPSTRKGKGHVYPKVQLYCLMGVAKAWTDWHVDFAGSSVYYHILHGSKVFYFIKPTPANLAAYEKWSGTEMQNHSWLGDMVDEVYKVELTTGNTMIIPTGWIHAVYTPVDTLVFGGNFLHSYNMATQLRVREIEIATQVPKKFRFPMFSKLCWYVGDKYLRDLKSSTAGASLPPRVLASIRALADFLVSEIRTLERGSDAAKKEVKDQIPADRVKDAPAMARELRWRANLASGHGSDDEDARPKQRANGNGNGNGTGTGVNGHKRKRAVSESPSHDERPLRFKNFKPRQWDSVKEEKGQDEKRVVHSRRPDTSVKTEEWKGAWEEWAEEVKDAEGEAAAEVSSRRDVVVKLRRTEKGLQRERSERVVEEWVWQ